MSTKFFVIPENRLRIEKLWLRGTICMAEAERANRFGVELTWVLMIFSRPGIRNGDFSRTPP
jgi:hypothetical protein